MTQRKIKEVGRELGGKKRRGMNMYGRTYIEFST
jgi:hypothetical protein